LLHDNAPAQTAASVCQFLTQKNVTTLYHSLDSPDLSPPDYFLSSELKMKLKGLYFAVVAEIQEAVTDELKKAQKEEFYRQLFRNCTTAQKPAYMPMELILNLKKRHVSSSCVFDF
jgi:HD-GYP domain-containing protein (c-di-GMP phosphodiesterase class II)